MGKSLLSCFLTHGVDGRASVTRDEERVLRGG